MHVKFSTLLALALSISLAYGCDSDDSNDTTYDYDSGVELDNDLSNADSLDTPDDSTTESTDEDSESTDETSEEAGDEGNWGAVCVEDADCGAPTDLCVKQPGETEGYCSIECPNLGADCTYEDWTCNIIGSCLSPLATWCGPPDEPEQTGGVVVACP